MQKKETRFVFSWTDCLISLDILCAAAGLSFLLRIFEGAEECTPMLFILAIFLISRYTAGYLFGTVSVSYTHLSARWPRASCSTTS